jgi:transcriptional regulator with XRE-family HTH domain
MTLVGNLLRQARQQRGLSLQETASLLGYINENKGARRVGLVESDGGDHEGMRARLAQIFVVDDETFQRAIRADEKACLKSFDSWVNTRVKPQMIVRYSAAVYVPHCIPEELKTHVEIEEYACNFAAENGLQVCLKLSRRHTTWIAKDGTVEDRTETSFDDPVNGPSGGIHGLGQDAHPNVSWPTEGFGTL